MIQKQYLFTFSVILSIVITGCATNPFEKFYQGSTNQDKPASLSGLAAIDEELPLLLHGTDPDADSRRMQAEGYTLLGTSTFFAGADRRRTSDGARAWCACSDRHALRELQRHGEQHRSDHFARWGQLTGPIWNGQREQRERQCRESIVSTSTKTRALQLLRKLLD